MPTNKRDNHNIILTAEQVRRRKKRVKIAKLLLLILIIAIAIVYAVLSFINSGYFFLISLDRNLYYDNGVIIYEDPSYKVFRSRLIIPSVDMFDDMSKDWLPDNLEDKNGSHNGDNYLAYTFYIENTGEDLVDYWDEMVIDDVIKNVDEAIRVRIYIDGKYIDYAKMGQNDQPEPETVAFKSDKLVFRNHVEHFKPKDIHKYTLVIWLEGDDPECTNNILGGEIKAHMNFKSEIVEDGEEHAKRKE